jgi:hypothetical protein
MNCEEIKADENPIDFVAANMATTSSELMLEQLIPQKLGKGDDIEAFIKECDIFFKFAQLSQPRQEAMIICFLDKEIREDYEMVDSKVKGFKDRLRKAFVKETSLLQDMRAALSYKQTTEDPKKYFDTIAKLVDKIWDKQWTKENMMEQLLVECSNEKDLKRDMCLNDVNGIDQIKDRIQKLHAVRRTTEDVSAIGMKGSEQMRRSYLETAKKANNIQRTLDRPEQRHESRGTREQGDHQHYRKVECWSCHNEGHFSRDCPKKVIKCFACGMQGHIRRECPSVRCQRCNRSGHYENACYTNLDRYRLRGPNEPATYSRRPYQEYVGNRGNTGYQRNMEYQGFRGNVGYQGQEEYQGMRRRPETTNRRYIANVEEDHFEDRELAHPNANASTEVEIVGAVY